MSKRVSAAPYHIGTQRTLDEVLATTADVNASLLGTRSLVDYRALKEELTQLTTQLADLKSIKTPAEEIEQLVDKINQSSRVIDESVRKMETSL